MTHQARGITVKWCVVTDEMRNAEARALVFGKGDEVEAAKREIVGKLIGREIPEGEKASGAWLTYLAEVNDLPDERPICRPLLDALTETGALSFGFFLA